MLETLRTKRIIKKLVYFGRRAFSIQLGIRNEKYSPPFRASSQEMVDLFLPSNKIDVAMRKIPLLRYLFHDLTALTQSP